MFQNRSKIEHWYKLRLFNTLFDYSNDYGQILPPLIENAEFNTLTRRVFRARSKLTKKN